MDIFDVEKTVKGRQYKATAKVEKGMLTVSSVTLKSKHAKVYSHNNEALALILLQELIDDELRKS